MPNRLLNSTRAFNVLAGTAVLVHLFSVSAQAQSDADSSAAQKPAAIFSEQQPQGSEAGAPPVNPGSTAAIEGTAPSQPPSDGTPPGPPPAPNLQPPQPIGQQPPPAAIPPPPAANPQPPPQAPVANLQPPPAQPPPPAANLQPPPIKPALPPPVQPAPGPQVAAPPPPDNKPLSDVFLEPYVFDTREGRRNPFKPYVVLDNTSGNALSLPGTPLERYELDEIRLVGIMWQIKSPKAMFVDPQGEVHVLAKDDRIGRHHGYIAAIREGEVVIIEPGSVVGESAYSTRILQLDRDEKK